MQDLIQQPFKAPENERPKNYEFIGYHLMASYWGCQYEALNNEKTLIIAMKSAVEASGATLLNYIKHAFPQRGVTLVMLLAESHSSIHTYPEHGACFVDLFTCGRSCSSEEFSKSLQSYLKPEKVDSQVLVRR